MIYKGLVKPFLFQKDPEEAHYFAFSWIKRMLAFKPLRAIAKGMYSFQDPILEKEIFGLKFPNPIGLAAGFDKDAMLYEELSCFGFGFIEIGTLTPKAQEGNPKPRLFRLPEDESLINRMGFNNGGVDAAIERLKNRPKGLIVGGNIGKNKVTPNDKAMEDYLICFEKLSPYVDYFVVNVSSPNTPNLRELQEKEPLKRLLMSLQEKNRELEVNKPILLKIAPDLTNGQLDDIVEIIQEIKLDGLIATNTTIDRSMLKTKASKVEAIGNGGLSGQALKSKSTELIKYVSEKSNKSFPIIAVGGIATAKDAMEKLEAGADLLQIYTGFIYEGPAMVSKINKDLAKNLKRTRF